MIRALTFGLEDDAQQASEVAGRPALLLEPAQIFGGDIVEFSSGKFSERHFPRAQLLPIGGGFGGIHGDMLGSRILFGKVDRAAACPIHQLVFGGWPIKFPHMPEFADDPSNSPQDDLHYREYKILLRPERFTSPQAFKDFWHVVKGVAAENDVRIEEAENAFASQVREVLFFDTPSYDLYNNHFIVRLRTLYQEGWPVGTPELTVKFRHPDLERAAAVDIRPALAGETRIKFKQELLPLKDRLGEIRSIYSHNSVLALPRETMNFALENITHAFPAFREVEAKGTEPIALVNDMAVEEVQVNVGLTHFGHHYNGKTTIAVWRSRKLETPVCGEFAFQCKFKKSDELHPDTLAKADAFHKELQMKAAEWVLLGTTKTSMVYGLGNKTVVNHE